ncbi:F0F1 ATP synthase subunit B [Bacillus sp. DJP31]|uniref:F0F1 ATP synthase subunit B n=1 Tax=Bacillus sp. DJP31 TaxID=3409789 RepID=UPI003BB7D55E
MPFNPDLFILAAEAGTFRLNTGDILFQLFVFLVLLALLRYFAFNPLMGIMKEREVRIANEIKSAEVSNSEAKKLVEEQRELLKQSRIEAQGLIENAKKLGEEQRNSIIQESRTEATRIKDSAIKEIQQEKDQAVSALREQVASLSVLIASKVIEKELNEQDQQKLISEYTQGLGEAR